MSEEALEQESSDYKVNIRLIAFTVICITCIVVIIYFVRLYSIKRQSIESIMLTEASVLEVGFSNEIKYAQYFLNLITRRLQVNYQQTEYVEKLIKDYVSLPNFNMLFGWRKCSYVDENFKESISSVYGIIDDPKKLEYVEKIAKENTNWEDKIFFYLSRNDFKNDSLKIISLLNSNERKKKYHGAVVLSYDIATMTRRLSMIQKNHYTNFIIVDENKLEILTQSRPSIANILKGSTFSNEILEALKKTNFYKEPSKQISEVNIFNMVNYHIRKINGLPYILIVNLDSEEIKNNILDTVTRKFVEISIFGFMFLLVVISIYKRETFLRTRAELATITANNATRAKSSFLSFTAHEIRSPLGFILTGSEIMTKGLFGKIPEPYIKYAEGIHQNSKLILDFITDILDENQIIEGKFKIINSIQDIKEIIKESINVNLARFNRKKIFIEFNPEPNLPSLICDNRRMLQVMSNLISNAIKYSNENSTIIIEAKMVNDVLEVSVTDQGIGMSEDEVKVALSVYGVVRKKSHNFIESYGLGLPIVQMLLNAHDGKLTIKSVTGVGTTVKVSFPKYKLIFPANKIRMDHYVD